MNNNKYIYGLTIMLTAGITLIGSSIYAADILPNVASGNGMGITNQVHINTRPENLIASLSGSISTQVLTEFTALNDTHKTKMEALMLSGVVGTIDREAINILRTEHQSAITELIKKYPELDTALKNLKGKRMEKGRNDNYIDFTSSLSAETLTKLQSIKNIYEVKHTTLKNQENAEILGILEGYPEAKKAFQEKLLNSTNREKGFQKHGKKEMHGRNNRGGNDFRGMKDEGKKGSNPPLDYSQNIQ